jgi:Zn-dependent metalloprotease
VKRSTAFTAVATFVAAAAVTLSASPAHSSPGSQGIAADPAARAAASADALVAGNAPALLKGPGDTMTRTRVQAGGNGLQYVSYERTYRNLPVVGGDSVITTNAAGTVLSTASAQKSVISVGTAPSVTADAAAATAKGAVDIVQSTSTPRLVVLAWGASPRLAWETVVTGARDGKPSITHVFVDALTGGRLDSYDDVHAGTGNGFYYPGVTIDTTAGSPFSMADPTRSGIRCGGQDGVTFTGTDDIWGNNSGTSLETACVDALYSVQREWDMLGSWLNRNGINGTGGGFQIRVGLNDVNAFWNGTFTSFGHSSDNQRQATPIDVVAHEFGHAIFQTTPGGAGSGNENGGINEGTGDIFGALTEAFANNPDDPPDFTVGEEVNLDGSGPIRFMYNPSLLGDPNCWSTSIPNTEVHSAAGPLNHWFYLVSQGNNPPGGPASPICTGGPPSVTGVGIQNAGKVYYNAMLAKTSTWRYANIRVASLNAARNLFPGSCTVFNTVKDAWNAVSVPAQSGEPTCVTGDDFSISVSPGSASVTAGTAATATVSTAITQGATQTVSLAASGLPSGAIASFSPSAVGSGGSSTMTIATSTTSPNGTFPITITGTGTNATHTTTFNLTITGGQGGCASPGQKLGNPGFETGTTPWTSTANVIGAFTGQTAHGGTRFAWLDGYGSTHTDTLAQTVSLPAGCTTYTLSFWLHIDSAETTTTTQYDTLRVQILNTSGTVLQTLATYSNLNKAAGYTQKSFNVSGYAGQTIQLKFTGSEDFLLQTSFVVDDTALNVS